jgi:hypothetical protein
MVWMATTTSRAPTVGGAIDRCVCVLATQQKPLPALYTQVCVGSALIRIVIQDSFGGMAQILGGPIKENWDRLLASVPEGSRPAIWCQGKPPFDSWMSKL